jgi:hypothetical protein
LKFKIMTKVMMKHKLKSMIKLVAPSMMKKKSSNF